MKFYSYVVSRDFGFAPNPFGEHCTLATCKPIIRKNSEIGDWIFGISPKAKDTGNKLVFGMKVTQKLTFNEYWNSPDFQYKKPLLNGSLKQMYGDNIYYKDDNSEWIQADSHHSKEDGGTNYFNLKRDTKGKYVLISNHFFYFGVSCIELPFNLKTKFSIGIGQKRVEEKDALELIKWLESNYETGLINVPKLFTSFQRYDGVS
jgi:hypothetical protein